MSVNRCKAETTSSQFVKWVQFIQDDINGFHREDWLFAQLCFFVRLIPHAIGGGKVNFNVEDFLLKFKFGDSTDSTKTPPPVAEPLRHETMRPDIPALDTDIADTPILIPPIMTNELEVPWSDKEKYAIKPNTDYIPQEEMEARRKASENMKSLFFGALKIGPDGKRIKPQPPNPNGGDLK